MSKFVRFRVWLRSWAIRHPHLSAVVITAPTVLLILLLLPIDACSEEPFVTKPSLRARLLIYGVPTVGLDGGSTLWARSKANVYETHPWLQDRGVMLAFKAGQAVILAWVDGILPPFWRWVQRIGAFVIYGRQAWKNLRTAGGAR